MEETQKINIFRPVVMAILTGFICLTVFESCKTNKLSATPAFKPMFYFMPSPPKHDTVTLKPHTLTDIERQAMINKFYEYGYKNFYGPKFDQLNLVITQQASSLDKLSTILTSTRKRTDSIVKERNYYKENYIRGQQESIERQKEIIRFQREYFNKNDKQIKQNSNVASICLVVVLIIAIAFLALNYKINKLSKRFNEHFKTISNA